MIPNGVVTPVKVISPEVKICAGEGNLYLNSAAFEYVEDFYLVDGEIAALYGPDSLHGIYVEGDSMEPDINDGDLVIFNNESSWVQGTVMIVCLNGRLMVRGLLGTREKTVLRAANKDYEDIEIKSDDFFLVYGRVLRIVTQRKPKPVV